MSYLPVVALLSILSFPCLAETLTEQFSRMDLNKDGFLSKQEFIQGMSFQKTDVKEMLPADQQPSAEKQKIIEETISESKKLLPFKVDQDTTWTDVFGKGDEIHYVYRIETDISSMSEEQISMIKPVMEAQICPKVKPAMCGIAKDALLSKGISLKTHYKDKSDKLLAECRFTLIDCK